MLNVIRVLLRLSEKILLWNITKKNDDHEIFILCDEFDSSMIYAMIIKNDRD